MIGSHNTDYDLTFYNDRVKEVMDVSIMAEPFTYVPIKAGHMELVGGNAVVFGKITEGYDIINPIVDPELSYEAVDSAVPNVSLVVEKKQTSITYIELPSSPTCKEYRQIFACISITLPELVYIGATYFISIENVKEDPEINVSVQYVSIGGDTLADIKSHLQALLGLAVIAGSPANQIWIYLRRGDFCNNPFKYGNASTIMKDFGVTAYIGMYGYGKKYSDLKRGATHGFGIVYKDRAGRQCSVVKTDEMNVYIPFYAEDALNLLNTIVKLNFKI
jgi:hypothetical protein